ncbi:MAG: hypothetical protein JST16_03055 [Bdellovibrionales bacterium]|nr:hypothetical protein [Bdellovibrionales bacterium]
MRSALLSSTLTLAMLSVQGCSSVPFTKKSMWVGLGAGVATGLVIGAIGATHNNNAWATLGAGVGGSVASALVTAISSEPKPMTDKQLIEDLLRPTKPQGMAITSSREENSYNIGVGNVPAGLKARVRQPRLRVGKTDWLEIDGEYHEPHKVYTYEEGGFLMPLRRN